MILVAHNERDHEEIELDGVTGKNNTRCPLYPGLTCRQHVDIDIEVSNSRDEELPRVPFVELHPNSFWIRPDGLVEAIAESDQFSSKALQKRGKTLQKELGPAYGAKELEKALPLTKELAEALDKEAWVPSLTLLQKLHASVKKPGKGLLQYIALRVESVSDEIEFAFEEIIEDDELDKAKQVEGVRRLHEIAKMKVGEQSLPILKAIEAWLKTTK